MKHSALVLSLSLSLSPLTAFAQAYYCADADTEGLSLKVDLRTRQVCVNGGPQRTDFCKDPVGGTLIIQIDRSGEVRACEASPFETFREFLATDLEGKSQWVRIFDEEEASGLRQAEVYGDLLRTVNGLCVKAEE